MLLLRDELRSENAERGSRTRAGGGLEVQGSAGNLGQLLEEEPGGLGARTLSVRTSTDQMGRDAFSSPAAPNTSSPPPAREDVSRRHRIDPASSLIPPNLTHLESRALETAPRGRFELEPN